MRTSGGTSENRAASPGGPRSRLWAPVYALVISFLAVLLLGVVVREPVVPPSVDLRFVTAGQGTARLDNAQVTVLAGHRSDRTVDAGGRVDDVPSDGPLTVCVRLPREWSAPAPAERLGDLTCWSDLDPEADGGIELVVTRSEVPR